MNKKFSIYLILMLVASVPAFGFEVSTEPITDKITLEEVAEYKLTITNTAVNEQKFNIRTIDFPLWDVYTKPVVNPITVDVLPSESESVTLFVDPLHITSIGGYDVNVKVTQDSTDNFKIVPLRVGVISQGSLIGGYVPTITATITMDNELNPTEPVPISVTVKNQNPIEYPEIKIIVESNLIKKEIIAELGAKEEKTFDFEIELDSALEPQKDTIYLSIQKDNSTITGPLTKKYSIISYSQLQEEIKPVSKFMRTDTIITFTNKGNVEYSGVQRHETTFFKSMFTSTIPKATTVKEDGKRYFTWEVALAPSEAKEVTVVENYLPFLIIVLLIGIALFLYYMFRTPFTINKTAAQVISKEGGIAEMKIVITLKSRDKMKLKDIEVTDRIPNIADIERELTIGTLQPTKILKHEAKGSILKWSVDTLDIGEERVISYRIKPILTIVGDLTLPPVSASYILKGKKHKVKSNSLSINPE